MRSAAVLVRRCAPSFLPQNTRLSVRRAASTTHTEEKEVAPSGKIELSKPTATKWKRPPFLKNLFVGKFDVELLAFPEVFDKEQVLELENNVKSIINVMQEKANILEMEKTKKIPEELLQDLKEMGLFGRLIPAKYGGLEMSQSALTRLNEALSLDWSVASALAAHECLAAQAILLFGTEAQKMKYLPGLASGKIIGAICCSEFESGSDLLSIQTNATLDFNKNYMINGTKSWVSNARIADVFIVFAKTPNPVDPMQLDLSVFIVDRETKDMEIIPQDTLCLHGLGTGIVNFKAAAIPASNLIGNLGDGYKIFLKISESFRLSLHSFAFSTLKTLLDSVTERIINCERVQKSLADYELIRSKLSRIQAMIYAMESVTYFTAGIVDTTENPDIDFESVAMKIFNSEGTVHCLHELSQLVGSSALLTDVYLRQMHTDATALSTFETPNDVMRMYLSYTGFKIVGEFKDEELRKTRNPLFYPLHKVKKNYYVWRVSKKNGPLTQDVAGHLHPSLTEYANKLERYTQRFALLVEHVLIEYGRNATEVQIEPKKIADMAIDLYAVSAVLTRSSRSYSIGLRNAEHEMRLSAAFSRDAFLRMDKLIEDMVYGLANNNERSHLLTGGHIVDCRGYFPQHPLKHNW